MNHSLTLFAALAAAILLAACHTASPVAGPVTPTWPLPEGVATQTVNGYPLAYRARGSGPTTVVFVGAVLTDYRVWARTVQPWEASHRVITVSLRHSYPEKWAGQGSDFSVEQHARDLGAFIQSLGQPVVLVGWSYGAQVSYEAARAQPGLVSKLVLVEAPTDTLVAPLDAAADKLRQQRAKDTARYLEAGDIEGGLRFATDAVSGPGAWDGMPEPFRQLMRDNAWTLVGMEREETVRMQCSEFGALKMPVLLVKGEATAPRFQQAVQAQARCLPSAKLAVVPQAGHGSPLQNAKGFNEAVMGFVDGG